MHLSLHLNKLNFAMFLQVIRINYFIKNQQKNNLDLIFIIICPFKMKTLQHYPIRLLKQLWSPTLTSQCCYSSQVNSAYPYTSELYKKNYIKYPVQSKSAICHDYVYHGDERLPSLKERLKGAKIYYNRVLKLYTFQSFFNY